MTQQDLHKTKSLLNTKPDLTNPQQLLMDIFASIIELLSIPETDVFWSSWESQQEAIDHLEILLELMEQGKLKQQDVSWLFTATGPLQEVSISSGWGQAFLKIADLYEKVEEALWGLHTGEYNIF